MNRKLIVPSDMQFFINLWRSSTALASLLWLLTATFVPTNARAALLHYDGFNYTVDERLGDPSSSAIWENAKDNIRVGSGSLSYPGIQASQGNRATVNGGSPNLDGARIIDGVWPSQTNGTLYFSFLLRVDSVAGIATSGNGTAIVNLSQTGSQSKQLISVNLLNDSGVRIGVVKYPSSGTAVGTAFFASGPGAGLSADGVSTYLVVAKYEWVDNVANDVVTVWVNPANLGASEDSGNKVSFAGGTDGTSNAGRFTIDRGPALSIDELRIGQTWAEVTPGDGGSQNPTQPVITEAFLSPAGFVLRGTNGPANTGLSVLATADLALAPELWPVLNTNQFDSLGDFDVTNELAAPQAVQFYRVRVDGAIPPGPVAPAITQQPVDRTVVAGQSPQFSVTASGTEPLSYQWYFNTNTPLAGADSNSWTVVNAQVANEGTYHVVITNVAGAVTSSVASLTIATLPPEGYPDGYATINGGTTGGAAGPTVTVDNFTDFESYVDNDDPYTVLVSGTINLGGSNVRVRDNKTIIGLGTDAGFVGDLKVFGNNNVIIRNLHFTNPGVGDNDGLTLQDCRNIWVDHCTFVDCDDGNLDISHGADWITVSWCHFYYTDPSNDHRFSNLVGHSDSSTAEAEDTGKLHVTFHHNWWGQLVHERMPRVRFGRVHVYNNYYNAPGNNNCIRAARDSEILVENNYFDTVKNVWELYRTVGLDGKVFATNNIEVNTYWAAGTDSNSIQIPGTDILGNDANGLNPPPYAYTLDAAAGIPNSVTNNAGAGMSPCTIFKVTGQLWVLG